MSIAYKRFPGDIEMEKGFRFGVRFAAVISMAGGRLRLSDLEKMTAMDLLNLFVTNDINLVHKPKGVGEDD